MRLKAILILTLGLIAASPGWAQDAPRPVGELTHNYRVIPDGTIVEKVDGFVGCGFRFRVGQPPLL
jgi:hypothetical protein